MLKQVYRKSTGINLVKCHAALCSVASSSKTKEQLLHCKPKLSKQWKVTSYLRSQGYRVHTPEVDTEDIGYYQAERCAEAGDEYDSKYPHLTSSGEDSDTGNDSPGTREHHHQVPRIGFPPSNALPLPVFPSGRDSLGELSQPTRLEQGMREMSLVLEDMIEGSCQERDSSWGLDLEGRCLVVGHLERNFDPNERFHGNPMHPEFFE